MFFLCSSVAVRQILCTALHLVSHYAGTGMLHCVFLLPVCASWLLLLCSVFEAVESIHCHKLTTTSRPNWTRSINWVPVFHAKKPHVYVTLHSRCFLWDSYPKVGILGRAPQHSQWSGFSKSWTTIQRPLWQQTCSPWLDITWCTHVSRHHRYPINMYDFYVSVKNIEIMGKNNYFYAFTFL